MSKATTKGKAKKVEGPTPPTNADFGKLPTDFAKKTEYEVHLWNGERLVIESQCHPGGPILAVGCLLPPTKTLGGKRQQQAGRKKKEKDDDMKKFNLELGKALFTNNLRPLCFP